MKRSSPGRYNVYTRTYVPDYDILSVWHRPKADRFVFKDCRRWAPGAIKNPEQPWAILWRRHTVVPGEPVPDLLHEVLPGFLIAGAPLNNLFSTSSKGPLSFSKLWVENGPPALRPLEEVDHEKIGERPSFGPQISPGLTNLYRPSAEA